VSVAWSIGHLKMDYRSPSIVLAQIGRFQSVNFEKDVLRIAVRGAKKNQGTERSR